MTTHNEDCRTADRLWAEYARTRDPKTRDALVHQFRRLAYRLANPYARRGVDNEDLYQVATIGLIKAVDRFDTTKGHRFSTFATPTILGEIRRYFRDHSWTMHVPRSLQELSVKVERISRQIGRELGRGPRAAEIADVLGVDEAEVQAALGLELANHPLSLDAPVETSATDGAAVLEETLGTEDREIGEVEHRLCLDQLLPRLNDQQRQVIELRYFGELSQREVARRLHVSQMHVLRLERRGLEQLRMSCAAN